MPKWFHQHERPTPPTQPQRFVARQPILDRSRRTFGYELLFRNSWQNFFNADGEHASRSLIDDAVAFGLDSLVGDTIPFLNCTRDTLLNGFAELLPRSTVLEVLETVEVDSELVAACSHLRSLGYKLALDDFDFHPRWEPLLPYADYIKVDFRASNPKDRLALIRTLERTGIRFVAEKVEDGNEFRIALNEGFDLFQGYFFTKPVVLARPALASVVGKVRLLSELNRPELDFSRMVSILKEESAVCYRLLRLTNSVLLSRSGPITDLHTALLIVGEKQFRKLAVAALTTELCGKQPLETHRTILQTARFCELMSESTGCNETELYLFGMMSVVRSVLDLSPEALAKAVNLRPDMMDALAGADNSFAQLLRCSSSYGLGDWSDFSSNSAALGHTEDTVSANVRDAQQWADTVLASAN